MLDDNFPNDYLSRRTAPKGKFRVMGEDTFHIAGDDFPVGDFDSMKEALEKVSKLLEGEDGKGMTNYYIYDSNGSALKQFKK